MQTLPSESPEKVQESGLQILQDYLYSNVQSKITEYRISVKHGNSDEIQFRIYPLELMGPTLRFVLGKGQLLLESEQAIDSSDTSDADDTNRAIEFWNA